MNLLERARDWLNRRKQAYVDVFDNPNGEIVLRDLAKFCRAHDTAFHADPRMHAVLEGRREVWLRIQRHVKLSDDQLWELYNGSDSPRQR